MKTQTIEQQINEMIPAMTEQVAAQIRQRAINNLEYTVANAVTEEVKRYVAEVIIPLVRADLEKHEAEIKAGVLAAVKSVALKTGEQLVEQTAKKLAGYEGDQLIRKIFNPLLGGY